MDAYQLLVLIIFIISCIEFVVSAIGYYLFRNVQPFKARSQGLLWPLLLCLMANQIKYYLILSEQNNCIADIWIEGIFGNATVFIYFVRAFRLLVIFNVTEKRFEEETLPKEEIANKKKSGFRIWERKEFMQEKYLMGLLACIVGFFILFPVIGTIITVANGDAMKLVCDSTPPRIGRALAILAFLMIIGINFKLHRVHDGYFLKNEFRILGVISIISAITGLLYLVVYDQTLRSISAFIFYAISVLLFGITYIIPLILCIKNVRQGSLKDISPDTISDTEMESSLLDGEMEEQSAGSSGDKSRDILVTSSQSVKSNGRKAFPKHKRCGRLINDPISKKYLEDFLVHYQDIKTTDYLIFYYQIREYRHIPQPEFLTGKAYLLFQKYLKKDGYRFIDVCPDDELVAMETKLKEAMDDENPKPVDYNFFDEVQTRMEDYLYENLFQKFFHSEFYGQYKHTISLKQGIELVNSRTSAIV